MTARHFSPYRNPFSAPPAYGAVDTHRWCHSCGGWFPEEELTESADGSAYVHPDDATGTGR